MRLLVVEDENLLRQQIEQRLSKEGYLVNAAEDGKLGLYYATESVSYTHLTLPTKA